MKKENKILYSLKLRLCRPTAALLLAGSISLLACTEQGDQDSSPSITETLLSSSPPPAARVPPGMRALNRPSPPPASATEITIDNMGEDFGDPDAPIAILEFFDYGCGYCRQFHLEILPALKEEYIGPGQVHWKSMPFIMGNWENSVDASLASECAGKQGRFEQMAGKIFDSQSEWKTGPDPKAVLETLAVSIGLDMDSYRSCIANDELLWRVQANTNIAQQFGVRSTPTFVVRDYGPIPGAIPLDVFREVLDTILSEIGPISN
jgi:protein-disulfide isomerase